MCTAEIKVGFLYNQSDPMLRSLKRAELSVREADVEQEFQGLTSSLSLVSFPFSFFIYPSLIYCIPTTISPSSSPPSHSLNLPFPQDPLLFCFPLEKRQSSHGSQPNTA